ncbi:alpha/beta hydrolase, partial [Spirochaetota bacterium]
RGSDCYAVNFRGHWLSDGHAELGKAITEDYVMDVEECLDEIGRPVFLIGHSMGGIVSQKVAEQNKSIMKLILLDSAPCKAITEEFFQPDPKVSEIIKDLFQPLPDNTFLMARDMEKVIKVLFEKNKVSPETISQSMMYFGRESAHVLMNHARLSIEPDNVICPVYVMGRTGYGAGEKKDLWHTLADYYNAEGRHISDNISHMMFMEEDWKENAGIIGKWCWQ